MSYDIFFNAFAGEAVSAARVEALLGDRLDASRSAITTADGGCDIYGLGEATVDGVMVNHCDGVEIYEVVVSMMREFEWAVLAGGVPVCITSERLRESIPASLQDPPARIVRSGRELRSIIEMA